MAAAAPLAASCSQSCYVHLNATACERFSSSGGFTLPCSFTSGVLSSQCRAPCRKHEVCLKFRFDRSKFCGERISYLPRLPGLISSHSYSPVGAHFNRDASSLGSIKYLSPISGKPMMTTTLGMATGASVICRGAAAAVAEIATLKPFLDKLMLLGTVMYYYITGVSAIPRLPELAPGGKRVSPAGQTVSAPAAKRVTKKPVQQKKQKPSQQVSNGDTWVALESKLSKALTYEDSEVEEQNLSNPVLSLQALARSPRQHLFYTTLHHLRKEVENITEADQGLSLSQWRDFSLGVLCRTVLPVCQTWVSQDFTVINQPLPVAEAFQVAGHTAAGEGTENVLLTQSQVLDSMTEFLKDTQFIRTYLNKSGKAELCADLVYFLRFGSIRTGGCCDYRSFSRFAGKALEDMVVMVADVVATLFLDSCSLVSTLGPQSETWQAFLLPPILSTRSLERFRNEVALNGWLNQYFISVVAMFEDRFDLWTLQTRPIPTAEKKQVKGKRPENGQKEVESPELVLTRVQLPARRSDELKALTGWRYYYSLYLEFSDVVGPLLGMLFTRLGEAVSFLLVRLIGRSLGLVYQGIRQSVRWSPK